MRQMCVDLATLVAVLCPFYKWSLDAIPDSWDKVRVESNLFRGAIPMRLKLIVAMLMASSAPAWAQTSIATSSSRSDSAALAASRATAIGGGNATGGNATAQGGNVNI